ncbi:MAG: pyruvate carboxylase subunit B, partial [Eggerthellaceae bacterium]|nr:pyruvate carboxylase subunit B [Eggerthellaceae bacterium]
MPRLQIMDTTIRDGQQSLWATRMPIGDMLPILPKMDRVGYWAIEAWGGATFDSCLRFLDENPWERLRAINANTPNTPLSMLSRGQNLVGYKHYSKEIVNRFIKAANRSGIEVFRVFDALNDIRNVVDNAEAIKECGAHFEGAISYTISPVHTLDSFLEYGQQLKDLGADSIAIKDMAGMLTPYRTERMVKAFNAEIGLPVHIHSHYVGGMAPANIIKAAEAGAAIADTAHAPRAFGNSHPAVEMIVAAFQESRYDTGLDLDLLFEISEYWEEVRKRGHYKRGHSSLMHMKVYSHQVPGGMMSNLVSQLETQKAKHRLPEVMAEIPKVRAEVGYPPLVTPMSQIVGTQAVMNVLTGKRWSLVSKEMKDYICGYYGKAPGRMDAEIVAKVVGSSDILPPDVAPGSLVTTTFDEVAAEIGDLARTEEDVLMYALFPNEARTYLSKHRTSERVDFLLEQESSGTKEEDYVDINQIRELVKVAEESGVGEIVVEEEGIRIAIRMPGQAAAPLAGAVAAAPAAPAAQVAQAPAAAAPAADDGKQR